MSGAGLNVSRGDQRKLLLSERDERISEFMRQRRSVAVIAELEGLEPDYCRKATRRLSVELGIDYKPETEPTLASETTRRFRANIANMLYDYRNKAGRHQLEVARDTGLTQAQQILASERGGRVDLKLSNLERLAKCTGQDFTRMMLIALLKDPADADQLQLKRVLSCLST